MSTRNAVEGKEINAQAFIDAVRGTVSYAD